MNDESADELAAANGAPRLAELTESVLDDATLLQLVVDITEHTTLLDVLLKGHPTRYTDGKSVGLIDAVEMLRKRQVRGVQIRYRWEGDEWRDTLFVSPQGVRIVRMRMDML